MGARPAEIQRHRATVLSRLEEISQALTQAHWRQDFESRWAAELLLEALDSNIAELRTLS